MPAPTDRLCRFCKREVQNADPFVRWPDRSGACSRCMMTRLTQAERDALGEATDPGPRRRHMSKRASVIVEKAELPVGFRGRLGPDGAAVLRRTLLVEVRRFVRLTLPVRFGLIGCLVEAISVAGRTCPIDFHASTSPDGCQAGCRPRHVAPPRFPCGPRRGTGDCRRPRARLMNAPDAPLDLARLRRELRLSRTLLTLRTLLAPPHLARKDATVASR